MKCRAVYIDILRIIACLMVIFNHTNERGFYRYINDTPGTLVAIWNLIFSISCKSAVPIFFMISGSMLLKKDESIKDTYKRIPKILFDLLFFSILYYWIDAVLSGSVFSLKNTLLVIPQQSYWHLWYLYSYTVLIITLPFLRDFAKSLQLMNAKMLYIVAVILLGGVPIFEYFVTGISVLLKPAWISHEIFIYPLMGYVIDNKIDIQHISKRHIVMLWIVNIFAFSISEVCEYFYLLREPGNPSETFLYNFCIINSVTIFITIKYLFYNKQFGKRTYKLVTEIGKCTFGIYLLHVLVLWKCKYFHIIWRYIEQETVFGKQFGIFASCIVVFFVAGIMTYALRNIPIIKRIF